jgi:hypothetical protein
MIKADNERSPENFHLIQKEKMEKKMQKSMKLAAKYQETHQITNYTPAHLLEPRE